MLTPCKWPEPGKIESNEKLLDLLMDIAAAFQTCAAKVDAIRGFYRGEEWKPSKSSMEGHKR